MLALAACKHAEPDQCAVGAPAACERDCNAGKNLPCEILEGEYLRAHDVAKATALVQGLCEGGRPYFCPSFAFTLVSSDPVRARQLFDATCADDPKGCSEYGSLIVQKDLELGRHVLDLACRLDDHEACDDLARIAP